MMANLRPVTGIFLAFLTSVVLAGGQLAAAVWTGYLELDTRVGSYTESTLPYQAEAVLWCALSGVVLATLAARRWEAPQRRPWLVPVVLPLAAGLGAWSATKLVRVLAVHPTRGDAGHTLEHAADLGVALGVVFAALVVSRPALRRGAYVWIAFVYLVEVVDNATFLVKYDSTTLPNLGMLSDSAPLSPWSEILVLLAVGATLAWWSARSVYSLAVVGAVVGPVGLLTIQVVIYQLVGSLETQSEIASWLFLTPIVAAAGVCGAAVAARQAAMNMSESPVPAPGHDAVAPPISTEIYGMPAFVSYSVMDIVASRAWYIEGLGFIDLFSFPGPSGVPLLVHLRRWKFQDILIRSAQQTPTPGTAATLSIAAVYGELDALADRARRHGGGEVEGPTDSPWNTRDLTTRDPDGNVVVFTAPRPPDQTDAAFSSRITELHGQQHSG